MSQGTSASLRSLGPPRVGGRRLPTPAGGSPSSCARNGLPRAQGALDWRRDGSYGERPAYADESGEPRRRAESGDRQLRRSDKWDGYRCGGSCATILLVSLMFAELVDPPSLPEGETKRGPWSARTCDPSDQWSGSRPPVFRPDQVQISPRTTCSRRSTHRCRYRPSPC